MAENDKIDGTPEDSITPNIKENVEDRDVFNQEVVVERAAEDKQIIKDAVEGETEEFKEINENLLSVLADSLLSTGEDLSKLLKATGFLTNKLKDISDRYAGLFKSYEHLIKKKDKHLLYLMASSIGVIVVSLSIVVVMTFSFSKQVNNMNALSMSLTKRIAEVNSGLVTFEELNASIRAMDESILQVAQQVETQQKIVQDITNQLAIDTRDQVEKSNILISEQKSFIGSTFADLQQESQNQQNYVNQNSTALKGLQSELVVMRGSVDQLIALKSSVDALVTLERERYLEAIQAKTDISAESPSEEEGVISFFKDQN